MATTHTYRAPVVEIGRRRRRRRIKQFLIQTLTAVVALAALGAGWFALYLLMSYGWQW
jgi:hypothetical protein